MTNFWQNLKKPFTVLAPMDDVTDNVLREIINEVARPDVFFTEFTNSDGLNSIGNKIVARKLTFEKGQHPIVAQIWGNNPESMEKASKKILKLGFDGIDINMGCPVHDVVKKGAGAGLIGNYENSKNIIDAVKKGVNNKIPVSVKTRLGINTNIAEDWASFLLRQDLSALTIHGRIAKQMSQGDANWDEIKKIVEIRNRVSSGTLIIGNGDVKSYSEVIEKYNKYNVDGVMIGRGIFSNPWVFDSNEKTHKTAEYLNLLIKHLKLFEKTCGENKNFAIMKKFFKMYINGFPNASELRTKLMETKSVTEAVEFLKTWSG